LIKVRYSLERCNHEWLVFDRTENRGQSQTIRPTQTMRTWWTRPRRRRREAFTTDAKIIRLTRRRVAFFPTAAARHFFRRRLRRDLFEKFPGWWLPPPTSPRPPTMYAPWKREGRTRSGLTL